MMTRHNDVPSSSSLLRTGEAHKAAITIFNCGPRPCWAISSGSSKGVASPAGRSCIMGRSLGKTNFAIITYQMTAIDTLIGKMTLAEKLGQLTMTASSYAVTGPVIAGDSTQAIKDGTIGNLLNMVGADHVHEVQRLAVHESRLGIPLLIGFDVVHGHRTLFPIPLGEAALFDPRMWALTARESAKEAAAEGIAMTFAPMLDVARDPRWGRSAEGPGEDPWLAARIAESKVHGYQGSDLAAPDALAATAKHFCAYGAVTAGATTHPPTYPNGPCTKCICPRS